MQRWLPTRALLLAKTILDAEPSTSWLIELFGECLKLLGETPMLGASINNATYYSALLFVSLESGLQAVHWLLQMLLAVRWEARNLLHWLVMLRELRLAKRFGPRHKQTEALLEKTVALLPDAPPTDLPSILQHLLLFGFEVALMLCHVLE